jgi:hypothetical protein
MKLIFERSVPGRGMQYLPACDVEEVAMPASLARTSAPKLPEISEVDLSRHYTELNKQVHGVNDGFYPLGSCTMKYNPRINEEMAALPGFTGVHPLAPKHTVTGCQEALDTCSKYMCEIFGMDDCTFQPAAGAHGEFTGVLLIKQYHDARGEGQQRTKIIVPDSAHGTNPATANMCGYQVVNIASAPNGCVDLEEEGVVTFRGVRFTGFGGCKSVFEKPLHYSETTMRKHIKKCNMRFRLHGGFDVLVTHAPAFGVNDGDDLPHRGFETFVELIQKYNPKYFVHGHVHMNYGRQYPREDMLGETKVINSYISYVVDI